MQRILKILNFVWSPNIWTKIFEKKGKPFINKYHLNELNENPPTYLYTSREYYFENVEEIRMKRL